MQLYSQKIGGTLGAADAYLILTLYRAVPASQVMRLCRRLRIEIGDLLEERGFEF
jgi:hypothetical protein